MMGFPRWINRGLGEASYYPGAYAPTSGTQALRACPGPRLGLSSYPSPFYITFLSLSTRDPRKLKLAKY